MIVPVVFKDDNTNAINETAEEIYKKLKAAGIRVYLDDRENHNPGFKYNEWELKGVPIRIELGKKDLEKNEVRVVRRDNGNKQQQSVADLTESIPKLLEQIHEDLYEKARKTRDEHIIETDTWSEFMTALNSKNLCLAPWCDTVKCEEHVKDRSKQESIELSEKESAVSGGEEVLTGSAKTLCIPFEQTPLKEGAKCFNCGQDAKLKALWGRSY